MGKIVIFVIVVVIMGEAIMDEHGEANYSTDCNAVKDKSNSRRCAAPVL